jgi:phospholipid/cholesterol/gamma-HCH transport system substrate-binding protein
MSRTTSAAAKMALFTAVTLAATALLAITIENSTYQSTHSYRAVFTDAVNLNQGDEVRLAGVRVGSVSGVQLYHGTEALVTFSVDNSVCITPATTLAIRYRNLIGQRYLAVVDASGGMASCPRQPRDAIIPATRTQPALNLNVLFNGFRPLLAGLDPAQVNQLSYELIQVLQGEGSTVDQLLTQVGSVTNTVADRDALIGSVIGNLNAVLGPIDQRDTQLDTLLIGLQSFISGLSSDRQAIASALTSINSLEQTTTSLLVQAEPALKTDIARLGVLAEKLDTAKSRALLIHFLRYTPFKLQVSTPETSYGGFLNFYVCAVNFILPDGTETLPTINHAHRCQI